MAHPKPSNKINHFLLDTDLPLMAPCGAPLYFLRSSPMSDTLLRHWTLLRAIPRAPRGITVAKLHRHVEQAGYPVRRRTVDVESEPAPPVG